MEEFLWTWLPETVRFDPVHMVNNGQFGQQQIRYGSPFWVFEMSLSNRREAERREIATILNNAGGVGVFGVYDPRVPVPGRYGDMRGQWDEIEALVIPALTVQSVSVSNSAILVQGQDGDSIMKDDPLEFTIDGRRHYYRAARDLDLDGTPQSLDVNLRPRVDVPTTSTAINRKFPRQRFVLASNQVPMVTNVNRLTDLNIQGTEFYGTIT